MYRYLLFQFDNHETGGGLDDLTCKFNTYDEFIEKFVFEMFDETQLLDTTNYEIKNFSSKITWYVNREVRADVKEKRRIEFLEWIKNELQ